MARNIRFLGSVLREIITGRLEVIWLPKIIDLTGQRFGRLTVLEYCKGSKWRCKCDCGNYTDVLSCNLRNGNTKSCGCLNKEHPTSENLTGRRFGWLTVLERAGFSRNNHAKWICQCDCGNKITVFATNLKKGYTKSCGCLPREAIGKTKDNKYEVVGECAYITIGGTQEKAICDKNMVDELSKYYWRMDSCGYVSTNSNKTKIKMHQLIIGKHSGEVIDHINRNKLDNRLENLRVTTFSMNCFNRTPKKNKSGAVGVIKRYGKWEARITVNRKVICLGRYEELEDAIEARKNAELKYRGEYSQK